MISKSLVIFVIVLSCANGRIVSRDELRNALLAHGIPNYQLETWLCIVKHESNFETTARNFVTGDHGIFQISQIYWCSPPGTGCGMSCDSLRDNDISNDIQCAQKVFAETKKLRGNGFSAWTTYKYCH